MLRLTQILFLLLLINIQSKTNRYYSSCEYGAPKSGLITYSDCKEYARDNNYCCLLYYTANPDLQINYNFYFKKDDDESREKNGIRKLSERVNLCFGVSNDGYNNIEDLIEEIEDESGIDEIHIDCSSKNLLFNNLLIVLLILL